MQYLFFLIQEKRSNLISGVHMSTPLTNLNNPATYNPSGCWPRAIYDPPAGYNPTARLPRAVYEPFDPNSSSSTDLRQKEIIQLQSPVPAARDLQQIAKSIETVVNELKGELKEMIEEN